MSEILITKPNGEVLLDIRRVTPEQQRGVNKGEPARSHMSESGTLVDGYAGFNYCNPYPSMEELERHGSMLRMVEQMVWESIKRHKATNKQET